MNGTMALPINGSEYHVAGGPYVDRPKVFRGVKLAPEMSGDFDLELPCRDFGTPSPRKTIRVAREALRMIVNCEAVYCGCAGGIGRTGTFLAVLAKACGIPNPVAYVREHYLSYAVETEEQEEFVDAINVRPLKRVLWWWGVKRRIRPGARV